MQDQTKQGPDPRTPDPTRQGFDGDDRLYSGDGDDVIYGGDGDGDGNDTVSGDGGNDYVYGDYGTESNFATGDDKLYGFSGNDYLFGAGGNDELYGGTGNDTIEGGTGVDLLRGDEGADAFVFDFASGVGREDRITDFEDGVDLVLYANLAPDAEFILADATAYDPTYDGAVFQIQSGGSVHTLYFEGVDEQLVADDIFSL